jgi:hypothetical protein
VKSTGNPAPEIDKDVAEIARLRALGWRLTAAGLGILVVVLGGGQVALRLFEGPSEGLMNVALVVMFIGAALSLVGGSLLYRTQQNLFGR